MARKSAPPTSTMSRTSQPARLCVICGEKAIGINFNAPTCMSCKAFFRRHALNERDKLKCPFVNRCQIDQVTRKFCARCRLEKCFANNMKKDHILTVEQRAKMKEKILKNRLLREQKKVPHRRKLSHNSVSSTPESESTASSANSSPNSNTNFSIKSEPLEQEDPCAISFLEPNPYFPSLLKSDFDTEPINSLDTFWDDYGYQLFSDSNFKSLADLDLKEEEALSDSVTCQDLMLSHQTNMDHSYSASDKQNPILEYLTSPLLDDIISLGEDPILESLAPATNHESTHLEIGFPITELILPEKYLIAELTSAFSHLTNHYKRIEHIVNYSPARTSQISLHLFNRLIRCCSQIDAFVKLPECDRAAILKHSLLEAAAIRSVLMFDEDREAWCVFDDKHQTSVYLPLSLFRHFCTKNPFDRHRQFPSLFSLEWKQDHIIFDLLTAIVLFTPRQEYSSYSIIADHYDRYCRLLHRYLNMKYAAGEEADRAYHQLMANIDEMRILNVDVKHFYRHCSHLSGV